MERKNGELVWKCGTDCPQEPIQLIPCFETGNSTIKALPKIIFNWAVYGHVGVLLGSEEYTVDSNCARLTIESIRKICHLTNESFAGKLGVNGRKVDLFSCSCSKYLTIFAFEPETMNFKFQIIDQTNVELFVAYLIEWFDPAVRLMIYESGLEFLKNYSHYFKTVERVAKLDTRSNQFFNSAFDLIVRNMQHGCENQLLFNMFLNEVIWRHNFGQTPYSTFVHIISVLRNQPRQYDRPSVSLAIKVEGYHVILDEIYYAGFDLATRSNINQNVQLRCNVRCHICYVPFNFQTIFNHLISHCNAKIRKRTQNSLHCDHCFGQYNFYDFQFHRELLEGRYKKEGLKTAKNACKICCVVFKNQKEVIKHLKELHQFQDLPYSCVLCPFRTSFYHENVSHYKRNHQELVKAYCKFCLQIYTGDDATLNLFEHIQRHMDVKDAFDCYCCALSFISDCDYKRHFFRDHIMQKSKTSFNFEMIKYKVEGKEENAALKVKLPNKTPIKIRQRKLSNGNQVSVEERRITKKDAFKLRYQRLEHEEILDKHYIIINEKPVICLECSQPMDTNHLGRRKRECLACGHQSYCAKALAYPCGLHFSSLMQHEKL